MIMNGRERCTAALNLEEPDVLPVAELNPGYYDPEKLGLDVVTVGPRAPDSWGHTRDIDSNTHVDAWGVTTRRCPETGAIAYIDYPIKSLEDLREYEPPSPADLSMHRIEAISREICHERMVGSGIGMEGTLSYQLMGFEGFLKALYTNPELPNRVNDIILSFTIELGKMMIEAGVEAVWLGDDYGYGDATFVAPAVLRKFSMPRLRKIVQAFHRAGAYVVKHTDGDNNPILRDIVETGVDAVHPIEPDVMDIGEVKELYGDKICLWGNIDCSRVLQSGTPAQVEQEVKECVMKASSGGGHVLGSSHSLHQNVKTKNVLAMIKAGRKYGKYSIGC